MNLTKAQILKSKIVLQRDQILDDNVLCHNCQGILINPKTCSHCDHFYCEECLQNSIVSSTRCLCGEIYGPKKIHKMIFKYLKRLSFNCENRERGCQEILHFYDIDQHTNSCDFKMLKCQNEFCESIVLQKDFQSHFDKCPYKLDKCIFCQENILLCDLEFHDKNCEKKPTHCDGCQQEMYQGQYKEHIKICEYVLQRCNNCSKEMVRKEMKDHTNESCYLENLTILQQNNNKKFDFYKQMTKNLYERLNKLENKYKTTCCVCQKFSCDVSKKSCKNCTRIFCIPCSRKNIKLCKICEKFTCRKCDPTEQCMNCQEIRNKKAIDKKLIN